MNGWRRARDQLIAVILACLLGMSFTAMLSGHSDPEYAVQRLAPEWEIKAPPGATCDNVEQWIDLTRRMDAEMNRDSNDDRHDLKRLRLLLDCGG